MHLLDSVDIQDGGQIFIVGFQNFKCRDTQVQIPCYTGKAPEAQHNPTWWTIGGKFSKFSKFYIQVNPGENLQLHFYYAQDAVSDSKGQSDRKSKAGEQAQLTVSHIRTFSFNYIV